MLVIMNWLGYKGLRLVQTLNDREQEKCKTSSGLFEVLNEEFKLQQNETILSLQYFQFRERKCSRMDRPPKSKSKLV